MVEKLVIRRYESRDFQQLAEVYRSAFAERPWNEFMKCAKCNARYSKNDVGRDSVYDRRGVKWRYNYSKRVYECKSCGARSANKCYECGTNISPVIQQIVGGQYAWTSKNFVVFWSNKDIRKDLNMALSQPNNIVLVAEKGSRLLGFTWGYELADTMKEREFPFLKNKFTPNGKTSYMDEIAVRASARRKGIGTALCKGYLSTAKKQKISEVVLRTDERNAASMTLFKSVGFESMKIYDPRPDLGNRIYLRRFLREQQGD